MNLSDYQVSQALITLEQKFTLDTICPWCKVGPGSWCRTRSGEMARDLHDARTQLINITNDGSVR